ncbi:MAG: radical SAM protein [Bacilli bacterium]|nr:radical SAM protein [Bacilli bacterium]
MFKKIGVFKDFTDGTIKCVYENNTKKVIEISLLFNKEDKNVVCAPTHHFCNMGCKMCHLTNKGLNKKMNPITQEDFMAVLLDALSYFNNSKKKLIISFMGVGEPLLNIDLIKDIYLNEKQIKEKYNYSEIGYAVSTMMPNRNVDRLIQLVNLYNIPLKLHFSLHTPDDKKRYDLIPNTKVSIDEAMQLLESYRSEVMKNKKIMKKYEKLHSTNDPVEIHYTLIKNVNDSDDLLNKLIKIEKKYQICIKFIRFNPINELERSSSEEKWIETLSKEIPNLRVKSYSPPGREVGSSCGEFTKHYYHQEIETEEELQEFLKWKEKHELIEE